MRLKGYDIKSFKCNITNINEVRELFNYSVSQLNRIDALYIVPSINVRKSIENYTYEEFERVVDVNLKGSFVLLKEGGISMMRNKEGGSIILISSIRHLVVEQGQSVYAATKAAMVQLAKTAAAAWGRYNIRVNCIAPGVVDTPLTRQIKEDPEWYRAYLNKTALRRWAEPSEIAAVAIFLAMPASSYITGSVIYVDAAWTSIDGRYEPKV